MAQREVAMRDRDLAQAERLIAECKNRIARQREVIANGFQQGHDTAIAVSLLRTLEAGLKPSRSTIKSYVLGKKERSGDDRRHSLAPGRRSRRRRPLFATVR